MYQNHVPKIISVAYVDKYMKTIYNIFKVKGIKKRSIPLTSTDTYLISLKNLILILKISLIIAIIL